MIKIGYLDVFKASFRLARKPYRFFTAEEILGNINGFNIVHCNDFVWGRNVIFAMVSVNDETYERGNIFVDDFFLELPDYVKEFIIQHEMGHVYHRDKMKLLRKIEFEINADMYAVDRIGKEKVVKSLQYLVDNTKVNRELKKRLKAIKN